MSHTIHPRRYRRRRREQHQDRMRRRFELVRRYRARPYSEWTRRERQRGVALVEAALVLPLIALLIAGGLGLGLAMVADVRLSHAASQAAEGAADGILEEDDAAAYIETAGGSMTCFWTGAGAGGCFDDGLDVARTQVVAETTVAVPFIGDVTPTASASALQGGGA